MKDIIALAKNQCKWPVGEGRPDQHLFCAAKTPKGHVYCVEHEALARAPTKQFDDTAGLANWFGGGKAKSPREGTHDGAAAYALDIELALAESKGGVGNTRLDRPENEKWAG